MISDPSRTVLDHLEPQAPPPPVPVSATVPAPSRPRGVRSLAPDLARGGMLLLIALANVWSYLYGRAVEPIGGRPVDAPAVDHLVDGLTALLVDDRARPMFAILYGFGIATMAARLAARGRDRGAVRGVLARRSVGLIVLGVLHAALLFDGDILAPYGVTGLLALALVHLSRRALLRWFWGAMALMTLGGIPVVFGLIDLGGGDEIVTPDPGYLTSAVERVTEASIDAIGSGVLMFFVPHVVLGVLLARSGWLTDPTTHRRSLGRVAALGGLGSLAANAPYALAAAGLWSPGGAVRGAVELTHELSGIIAGLAYVCAFGWVAAVWADRRRGPVVRAMTAVGERSLTCYLLQSLLLAPLLSAWGLGLGARLGTAQAATLAVGVWLLTVAVAVGLRSAGRTGPFEALLRRWTYGPRRVATPPSGPGAGGGSSPAVRVVAVGG